MFVIDKRDNKKYMVCAVRDNKNGFPHYINYIRADNLLLEMERRNEYGTADCEKEFNGIMFVNIRYDGKYWPHSPKDLCPDCSKELLHFMSQNHKSL